MTGGGGNSRVVVIVEVVAVMSVLISATGFPPIILAKQLRNLD